MLSLVWKNKKDRENYEPIIKAISERLIEVERDFDRPMALQYLQLSEIVRLNRSGYLIVPIEESSLGIRCIRGYEDDRCDTGIFQDMYVHHDDAGIGRMLGFPSCCTKHFSENWKSGQSDPTRFMGSPELINPYTNILYRWLGVRPVFHLPCSFNCEATIELGKQIVDLYGDLKEHLLHILSLPVTYSLVNGIVEVSNPLFKFYTDDTDVIDKPIELSSKLQFCGGPVPNQLDSSVIDTWSANGFSSLEAMNKAHDFVVKHLGNLSFKSILDLGCGNGLLLKKVQDNPPRLSHIYGIDSDTSKFPVVKLDYWSHTSIKNFCVDFHGIETSDVIMISYERFIESEDCMGLFNKLLATTNKYLVITSYNGKACRYPFDNSNGIEVLWQQEGENTITVYRKPLYEN